MSSVKLFFELVYCRLRGGNAVYEVLLKNLSVLDVGCGQGELLRFDKDKIQGIDLNKGVVEKLNNEGLKVVFGSACDLPFGDCQFDAVHCRNVIEHLSPAEARSMIMEMARVLKPNGRIVLMTPTENTVWNTFGHIKPYNPTAIRKLFLSKSLESFDGVQGLEMSEVVYFGRMTGKLLFFLSSLFSFIFPVFRGMYLMIVVKK